MTNAEMCEYQEKIADQICVILRSCDCDMTKINPGLWTRLVLLYRIIEEYV